MKRVLKRYRLAVVFGLVFLIFSSILISIKVMASAATDNGYRAEGNGATTPPIDLSAIGAGTKCIRNYNGPAYFAPLKT